MYEQHTYIHMYTIYTYIGPGTGTWAREPGPGTRAGARAFTLMHISYRIQGMAWPIPTIACYRLHVARPLDIRHLQ